LSAYALESEAMRVIMVPTLGAKIVSLYDKTHRREWLVPPIRPVRPTAYGDDFVSQDMCGWDEMMPTIDACEYQDKKLPDHGEIWSIPWKLDSADGNLSLSVEGVALPFRFIRTAALIPSETLEPRYCLLNTGQQAFPYLWMAHPQFAADAHTRIVFPPEVTSMVNIIENDPVWGAAGVTYPWPMAPSTFGLEWRLDHVQGVENHASRKFYIRPEQSIGWAALVDEGRGCQLRLEWPAEFAPYLGLWIDEGMFNTAALQNLCKSEYCRLLFGSCFTERCLKPGLTCSPQA
jgi:hypothetical protein